MSASSSLMAAMAFVTRAWHVLALRAVQGLFAGYGSLSVAMAAESAPRDRMPSAIGAGADRAAPRPGGRAGDRRRARRHFVGLRRAFLVTAVFYAVGLVLVLPDVRRPRDPRVRPPVRPAARARPRDVPQRARVREFHPDDGRHLRAAVRRSQLRAGAAAVRRAGRRRARRGSRSWRGSCSRSWRSPARSGIISAAGCCGAISRAVVIAGGAACRGRRLRLLIGLSGNIWMMCAASRSPRPRDRRGDDRAYTRGRAA